MPQTATRSSTQTPGPAGQRLGKEVADFLIEFSIALHRFTMYPADHPTLGPAADGVLARLARLMEERSELSLGVAQRQLLINGVATDRKHPVLAELANRLHDNHIGAIRFTLDVERSSIEGLLRALSAKARDGGESVGLGNGEPLPRWPGLVVAPIGYDELALDPDAEEEPDDQVLQLWLGLAQAALMGPGSSEPWPEGTDAPDPSLVARHLRGQKARAYDEAIASYLLQISQLLAEGDGRNHPLRERITELLAQLDRATLQRILKIGGDAQRRRQIVQHAFQGLGGTAALKILEAAAATDGQEISVLMVRMLTKLSFHAEQAADPVRPHVASLVRETVDELLEGWRLDDPNPEGYVRILDELSKASPYLRTKMSKGAAGKASSLHLLQMSVEVDTYGDMVGQALDDLLVDGGLAQLRPILELEPANDVVRTVRARVADPQRIESLADADQVSEESLELLTELVGAERAVEPLLRLLAESQSRSLRRTVFDRLISMADQVGPAITPFLEDPRWYVVRNMLELVAALPAPPRDFSALPFASHPDLRVRRAALPLALAEPGNRTKAIVVALRDGDDRLMRTALLEVAEDLPGSVVPLLIDRCVRNPELSPSMRLLGLRALAGSRDPVVKKALLDLASGGRTIFGRARLASTDGPEGQLTRAAFEILLEDWGADPEVDALARAAEKSRDPVVARMLASRTVPDEGDTPSHSAVSPGPTEEA